MKILVIQTAFIGDVILATPIVEKLHSFYPQAQIDFLVRKGNESLFTNSPCVNKILIYNKKTDKYKNLLQLIKVIRKESYDIVINVQRHFTTGLITSLSKGKTTIGFKSNPLSLLFSQRIAHYIGTKGATVHDVDRNLSLVSKLTDNISIRPKLYPSNSDFTKMNYQTPYICIAPSSVWFTKQLPAEKWVELIKQIDKGTKVFLLGGKEDRELCEKIKEQSNHANTEVMAGQLSFLESAALMKGSKMNYVNDSAPMHIASSMNAPVTAIYCSTVPAFGFGPLSDNSRIAETKHQLSCRPCGLHGKRACPKGHFKCADIDMSAFAI